MSGCAAMPAVRRSVKRLSKLPLLYQSTINPDATLHTLSAPCRIFDYSRRNATDADRNSQGCFRPDFSATSDVLGRKSSELFSKAFLRIANFLLHILRRAFSICSRIRTVVLYKRSSLVLITGKSTRNVGRKFRISSTNGCLHARSHLSSLYRSSRSSRVFSSFT
jgi:hypothetical protein